MRGLQVQVQFHTSKYFDLVLTFEYESKDGYAELWKEIDKLIDGWDATTQKWPIVKDRTRKKK